MGAATKRSFTLLINPLICSHNELLEGPHCFGQNVNSGKIMTSTKLNVIYSVSSRSS